MNRSVIPCLLAANAYFAVGLVVADDSRLQRYELPNLDTLELTLPPGWVEAVEKVPASEQALTIELAPVEGPDFRTFVTPQWLEQGEPAVMDADALHGDVQQAADRIRTQATEKTIEIRRLQGESGVGFYFSATDRVQAPGEYRFMTQGALQVGDLVLWFTILTNEEAQDSIVRQAFGMLQSAVHRETGLDQR